LLISDRYGLVDMFDCKEVLAFFSVLTYFFKSSEDI
jgi:hypothetical protein